MCNVETGVLESFCSACNVNIMEPFISFDTVAEWSWFGRCDSCWAINEIGAAFCSLCGCNFEDRAPWSTYLSLYEDRMTEAEYAFYTKPAGSNAGISQARKYKALSPDEIVDNAFRQDKISANEAVIYKAEWAQLKNKFSSSSKFEYHSPSLVTADFNTPSAKEYIGEYKYRTAFVHPRDMYACCGDDYKNCECIAPLKLSSEIKRVMRNSHVDPYYPDTKCAMCDHYFEAECDQLVEWVLTDVQAKEPPPGHVIVPCSDFCEISYEGPLLGPHSAQSFSDDYGPMLDDQNYESHGPSLMASQGDNGPTLFGVTQPDIQDAKPTIAPLKKVKDISK